MGSNWFDFDDEMASEFFEKSKIDRLKKNTSFGIGTNRKQNILIKESWIKSNEVNDTLNLTTSKCDLNQERSKFTNSQLNDQKNFHKNSAGQASRFSEAVSDDFFSDATTKVSKIKSHFSGGGGRYETENLRNFDRPEKKEIKVPYAEQSSSYGSANNYAFSDEFNKEPSRFRKDSVDSSWSRKSCQPNVSFPSSSASTISDAYCGSSVKFDRSISRDSDDSTCTEKTVNSSTISEKLADGTDKIQFKSNESWLKKSNSGSKISEKKVNDMTKREMKDNEMCEESSTQMSYLEKSATGSSLQEEIMSTRVTSLDKDGTKTVEEKTSSETFKKKHQNKSVPSHADYYDDSGSYFFEHPVSSYATSKMSHEDFEDKTYRPTKKEIFSKAGTSSKISEKLSKLIDEAACQDHLFKIPRPLQTDIDKITEDFFNLKSYGRDKARTRERLMSDLFSKSDKEESYATRSNITRLKSENDSLHQENLKLQSIIQDVTTVNKRWQKYNNERRLYVQKLLSTIQDLQEQINLISEKSAFQSKSMTEKVNSQLDEIKRLKKEHQERVTVLEHQMETHKEDWDAAKREKQKAIQERYDMENKVHELMREVEFLKTIIEEGRQQKKTVCIVCNGEAKDEEKFLQQGVGLCSQEPSINVANCSNSNCCSAMLYPYEETTMPGNENYYNKKDILEDHLSRSEHNIYSTAQKENLNKSSLNQSSLNERFNNKSSKTKHRKPLKSDTVVVADESGLCLAITEQYPSKDINAKSTFKKREKKSKSGFGKSYNTSQETEKYLKSVGSRLTCTNNPNITCEQCILDKTNNFELSIGFQGEGQSQVISFVPNVGEEKSTMHYLSIGVSPLINGEGEINRSRSVPNTRSNSAENLKPLRESSSWNNQFLNTEGSFKCSMETCLDCNGVCCSSTHLRHLSHYETNQPENNHF